MCNRSFAILCFGLLALESQADTAEPHFILMKNDDDYQWEFRADINSQLSYRVGGYSHGMLIERKTEYVAHSANLNNRAITSFIDWHPFGGNFRISSGLFITNNKLNFISEPIVDYYYPGEKINIDRSIIPRHIHYEYESQTVKLSLNGQEHMFDIESGSIDIDLSRIPDAIVIRPMHIKIDRDDINVTGNLRFRPIAPYLGFGWANRPESSSHLRFGFDIGLMYHGRPELDMQLNGRIMEVHPYLTAELNNEFESAVEKLQAKTHKFRMLPYAAFGLSMRL